MKLYDFSKWYSMSKTELVFWWITWLIMFFVLFMIFETGEIYWKLFSVAVFFNWFLSPFSSFGPRHKSYSLFLHPDKRTRAVLWFMIIFGLVGTIFITYWFIPDTEVRNDLFILLLSVALGMTLGLARFWPKYKKFRSGG